MILSEVPNITQEIDPDILTRLKNGLCAVQCRDRRRGCDCTIAADEIERLRRALLQEREDCAHVAEHLNGWGLPQCADLAHHIAKCIRERHRS